MRSTSRYTLLAFASLLMLSACGDGDRATPDEADADPGLTGALGDEMMVDPDLAGQNQAGGGGAIGSGDGALPPENNSPKEIAAAKSTALKLVGGQGKLKTAPAPRLVAEGGQAGPALTAAAQAAALGKGGINCAEKAEYTMAWAAKLPKVFPVYPRGNTQEAAGTDADGCSLRVVNYTTPVTIDDVVNFYYSRASAAGYSTDHIRQGGDELLGGVKGSASYLITARRLPSGRTEVDMVTTGK